MRFSDVVGVDRRPDQAVAAQRTAVDTDTYLNKLADEPRNNGFVSGLFDRRRGQRMTASRRGFLRGTIAAAAATTAATTATLFGPARRVEAQSGVVGTYPRRILQYCPPYNSNDNCQPGCGSSPICTDCCGSDGFFRNDPANGYSLYAGGCGDGDIADGWVWRFKGKCGNCAEIEYRCSDGYVQTDTGPAPFICRSVTDCVPLADGEDAGPSLIDAARDTNWRPAGALEVAIDQGSTVAIHGWIADGSGVPLQMRIRANNAIVHLGTAALVRPDIESRVRGAGPNTGFAVSFPVEPGEYEFCVDALQGNLNATVGCVRLNVGSGGSVRGGGVTGSISPPAATPAPSNPSNNSGQPTPTPTPSPTPGEIVLPAIGATSKSRTYGAVQVIRRSAATTGFVSGWAGDPDTTDAAFIEVMVDGESVSTTRTDLPRPDVARAFADLNPTTGFALSFELPEQAAEVCVEAVSPDDGRRQPLGCQTLRASAQPAADPTDADPGDADPGDADPGDADPGTGDLPTATGNANAAENVVYGGIDSVVVTPGTPSSTALVTGWSFDPNERDRTVAIEASASGVTASTETSRTNAAAQRIYGLDGARGFEAELALPPGTHELTVTATAANGRSTTIGSQTIVVT